MQACLFEAVEKPRCKLCAIRLLRAMPKNCCGEFQLRAEMLRTPRLQKLDRRILTIRGGPHEQIPGSGVFGLVSVFRPRR